MLCKMFKYSLFICKCSERESHFDCHIDCHFDCNLQLIVNFLSDNMSELKGVRSGAERMKKDRACLMHVTSMNYLVIILIVVLI